MSNYPDTVKPNDPKAPWNEKPPLMTKCERCDGSGMVEDDDKEIWTCEICEGSGEIEDDDE